MRTTADVLKKLRKRSGETQGQTAEKLNISRSTLQAIENGAREIRLKELQQILSYYNALLGENFTIDDITSGGYERIMRQRALAAIALMQQGAQYIDYADNFDEDHLAQLYHYPPFRRLVLRAKRAALNKSASQNRSGN